MSTASVPDPSEQRSDRTSPTERILREHIRGTKPGNSVVRIRRPEFEGFSRRGKHLEANLELERPAGAFGVLRRWLVGAPIHTELESHERLSRKKALAVFSSDALSSVAYAPQEVLLVLAVAGTAALAWSLPISVAIILLLAIVVTSYRQTIYAYPSGGGSYIVARQNLGEMAGLMAASALVVGYILTVSVSIASAVDQLISAASMLGPFRIWLGVAAVAVITIANLRGIRESGTIFAIPTYVFLVGMYALIGAGLFLLLNGQLRVPGPEAGLSRAVEPLSAFLILRAFATGSAVMTGTEAISNGIPAFQKPESRNAARTIVTMALILASMFLGLAILVVGSGIVPSEEETLISLFARSIFGTGPLYYLITGSTALILVLAANTAFADFPRLASLLARDDYAPHQLAFRGDRLAFSNGIVLLGTLSALLIVLFGGSTGALLPLYALSVFAAFTFSQAGMVRHWRKERGPGWQWKSAINGVGATVTGLVALIAAGTNFMNQDLPIVPGLPIGWGSWLVLIVVPVCMWLFLKVKKHYDEASLALSLPPVPDVAEAEKPLKLIQVVPISQLNLATTRALRYASTLSSRVVAVHIGAESDKADELEKAWPLWAPDVPLIVVESPYRSLLRPLLRFLFELKRVERADIVSVVLGEFVPDSWWEHLLHNQTSLRLKTALLFTPGFVVTSVPCHESEKRARTAAVAAEAQAATPLARP